MDGYKMLRLAADRVENQSLRTVPVRYNFRFHARSSDPYNEFTPCSVNEYTGSLALPFWTVYKPRTTKSVTCTLLISRVFRIWFPPPVSVTSKSSNCLLAVTRKSRLV